MSAPKGTSLVLKGMLYSLLIFLTLFPYVFAADYSVNKVKTLVISTWKFPRATESGWRQLNEYGGNALDAVVAACSQCEEDQCDGTVGYGGSPDENGESYLDAMIMDGATMDVGAVANLREIKDASKVARMVLEYTEHTILVGEAATEFAVSMGFQKSNLSSEQSIQMWKEWKSRNCQPNFWKNVYPDPKEDCGPYKPKPVNQRNPSARYDINQSNHDTIGVVAIDSLRRISAGTSTNGARFKIPGRVGDSPIVGSGAYADNEVGAATATGDGDVMMRFSPSFHAVELMRNGMSPTKASEVVIQRISSFYPKFFGAVISVTKDGEFGASCHGMAFFPFTVITSDWNVVKTFDVKCLA